MSHDTSSSKFSLALHHFDTLPCMPEIAHRLLALPLETDAGETQLLGLIAQDPQLSARIIGLANAPAMGAARRINSIQDAALLLGLKRLKAVAIGMATLTQLDDQPASRNFDPHDLWSHSIAVAIVMNRLAQFMPEHLRPDENQAFLAGLLHDIGFMVLHHLDHAASNELHRQIRLQPKRAIHEIELDMLGTTHGDLGARLLQQWHLPDELVIAVKLHHAPDSGQPAGANTLGKMINISERLLQDLGIAEHHFAVISTDEWSELGIAPTHNDELTAMANELAIQVIQLPEAYRTQKMQQAPAHQDALPPSSSPRHSKTPASAGKLLGWARRLWH